MMALSTSIFHIYITSHYWVSAKPPVGAWVIGLNFWVTHFDFSTKYFARWRHYDRECIVAGVCGMGVGVLI